MGYLTVHLASLVLRYPGLPLISEGTQLDLEPSQDNFSLPFLTPQSSHSWAGSFRTCIASGLWFAHSLLSLLRYTARALES